MGWLELVAAALKIVGTLLDMKAKNQLSQQQLDMAIRMLEAVQPPKGEQK